MLEHFLIFGAGMLLRLIVLAVGISKGVWRNEKLLIIFVLTVLSVSADGASGYVGLIQHENNLYINHVYRILEFVALSLFFLKVLPKKRTLVSLVGLLNTGFLIVNALFIQGLCSQPTYAYATCSLILIALSILAFHRLFVNEESDMLSELPDFWILCGVLLYFGGSIFCFLMSTDILSPHMNDARGLWMVHNGMLMLQTTAFGIAFLRYRS